MTLNGNDSVFDNADFANDTQKDSHEKSPTEKVFCRAKPDLNLV